MWTLTGWGAPRALTVLPARNLTVLPENLEVTQVPVNKQTIESVIQNGYYGTGRVHLNGCKRVIGPRGGVKDTIVEYRFNGQMKTWKTRPNDFSLPIKTGFTGPYGYITQINCDVFHWPDECPLWTPEQVQ